MPQYLPIKNISQAFQKGGIYFVLIFLVLGTGIIEPSFLSIINLKNVLQISAVRVIIALGVGSILITRGTDLSSGRIVGLTACIAASLMQKPDYAYKMFPDLPILPLIAPIIAVIVVGLFIGTANGLIISTFQIPPFIATLGMMVIVYGLSSLYTNAQPIGGLRQDFTNIATGSTLNIPNLILISGVIIATIWFLLNKTVLGKYIYSIGSNTAAALVSGVNVKSTIIKTYALGGALYGLAGLLLAARTGGATNNYATMYELDAIAACTIGGVSTAGGIGTVSGIVTGVLIFEVLNNGLVILGVSPYWQQIIKGVIIIAAIAFDTRKYINAKR
ncbi:methyl-galactoside transport system permease protein [Brevinema andersonii]|uniref:Methyl-galactoside transport system permease protein n=1 Tax=Brevinema andersonii TaxID=34097 RepID=A0A1I1DB94_BREAD|nr:galactose/methyl galactoside ABC transporter permease MglC [Brevinema andersonii]SFB70358.1 methyl-galactoside transport system permease protein [Brevinema andersonii]